MCWKKIMRKVNKKSKTRTNDKPHSPTTHPESESQSPNVQSDSKSMGGIKTVGPIIKKENCLNADIHIKSVPIAIRKRPLKPATKKIDIVLRAKR